MGLKHLFYIHSPLNYVVAKRVIEALSLPESDCVLLYDRIAPIQGERIPQAIFPHDPQPAAHSFMVKMAFWQQWPHVKRFDDTIAELAQGQPFMFYALFSWGNFFYLLLSHRLCQGYYYTEDGIASLNPPNYLENSGLIKPKKAIWLRQLLYFFNFPFRGVPCQKRFYDLTHPKFKGVLATCQEIFPNFPQKKIIGFGVAVNPAYAHYEHVVVLDGTADFGLVSQESYAKAVAMLPEWFIKNGIYQVHVKYQKPHPNHPNTKQEMQVIFERFADQVTFVEIPNEAILEEIAFSSKANFYVNTSSIGFYAYLAGRKVYTWIDFLQVFEPDFKSNPNQPKAFLDRLIHMRLQ